MPTRLLVNPFWSTKAREESRLREMRPKDLPPVPPDGSWDDGEEKKPIQAGAESRQQMEAKGRSPPPDRQEVGSTYRTPPSSWTETRKPPASIGQIGQAGESSSLERELEKRMFEWVQEENWRLKMEIERLRQRESTSSWSQASEKMSPVPPPPRGEEGWRARAKFTPNRTRVPDMPPPEDMRVPEFPWWTGQELHGEPSQEEVRDHGRDLRPGVCGGAKVCPGPKAPAGVWGCGGHKERRGHGGAAGDHIGVEPGDWGSMRKADEERATQEVMTPLEARAAWLEREARRLQEAMNEAHGREGGRLKSFYWSVPFEKAFGKEGEESSWEERDSLKAIPIVLPKLVEPSVRNAPLEAGDWIAQLTPLIGDVSSQAASWWHYVMEQVTNRYQQWLEAGPLQKLNIECPDPEKVSKGHTRLAQRITTLLLGALPESLRQELVATRQLHVPGIMFAIYRRYQPGGLREKTQMLAELTGTKPAGSPAEAVEKLRLWRRQLLRAIELQAMLPDPILQVKALDTVMQELLKRDAQASFRISAYRLQHQVDVRPDAAGVQKFFELLLAEADLMQHARQEDWDVGVSEKGESEEKKNPLIKQVTGPNNPRPTTRMQVCRFWGTDSGCKLCRSCKWSRDWNAITDKPWLCSSKPHVKQDCPSVANNNDPAGGSTSGPTTSGTTSQKGHGKGEGKDGKGAKGKKGQGQGKASTSGSNVTAGSEGKNGGESMPEVKSMQTEDAKSVASSTDAGNGSGTVGKGGQEELMTEVTSLLKAIRLDRGPQMKVCQIRKMMPDEEMRTLIDGGATHCLRQARSQAEWEESVPVSVQLATGEAKMRHHLQSNTLVTLEKVQPIVPVTKLMDIGYTLIWTRDQCRIEHSKFGQLSVTLVQGCPTVDSSCGQKLVQEIEQFESRRARIRAVLLDGIVAEGHYEKEIAALRTTFPEVPMRILEQVPGESQWDVEQVPWNRRWRKKIAGARGIVINVFSGSDTRRWRLVEDKDIVVINVDLELGANVMDPHVSGWIESLVESGKLIAWTSGPPCRTVSWCRYRTMDGGPPPLTGREGSGRFGLANLSAHNRGVTDHDTTLWVKNLWWMRKVKKFNPRALVALEQPQDPWEWLGEGESVNKEECPSFLNWPETHQLKEDLGLKEVRLCQGGLGHSTSKPTTILTDMAEVQLLEGVQGERSGQFWKGKNLQERIVASKSMAEWAPGLVFAMCEAIKRNVEETKGMRALSLKERQQVAAWQAHADAGHTPYRKDCKEDW